MGKLLVFYSRVRADILSIATFLQRIWKPKSPYIIILALVPPIFIAGWASLNIIVLVAYLIILDAGIAALEKEAFE